MAAPATITDTVTLSTEYQNFIGLYANVLSAANAFVAAGNVLTVNPNISIASSPFKTAASTVLAQVTTFLQTAPTSFPAA
jgi:hypothetical protein